MPRCAEGAGTTLSTMALVVSSIMTSSFVFVCRASLAALVAALVVVAAAASASACRNGSDISRERRRAAAVECTTRDPER